MHRSYLRSLEMRAQGMRDRAHKQLTAFYEKFHDAPWHAFEWASESFQAAADQRISKEFLEAFETFETDKAADEWIMNRLARALSELAGQSTSACHNEMTRCTVDACRKLTRFY